MSSSQTEPQIFVWHEDRQQGPFSAIAMRGALKAGKFPSNIPAWTADDDAWRPLAEILKAIGQNSESTSPGASPNTLENHSRQILPPAWPNSTTNQLNKKQGRQAPARSIAIAAICVIFLVTIILVIPKSEISSPKEEIASDTADATKCTVLIQGYRGKGSGSIVWHDGEYYLYTNVHVASMGKLSVSDYSGVDILISDSCQTPQELGVDLVRFKLLGKPKQALLFADRSSIEQEGEAYAIGDSGGEGVLRTMPGKVIAVGPEKIEVDCNFISGNSGGPIVNSEGELLALASYMTASRSIWAKGTSLEIRRFGWIPSANYTWQDSTANKLSQEQQIIEECKATSRLLMAFSYLNLKANGVEVPKSWPIKQFSILDVLNRTKGHSLKTALDATNYILTQYDEEGFSTSSDYAKREYLKFFKECEKYAAAELEDSKRSIKSGFWRKDFESRLNIHHDILSRFKRALRSFERSGNIGGCLAEE